VQGAVHGQLGNHAYTTGSAVRLLFEVEANSVESYQILVIEAAHARDLVDEIAGVA